MTVSGSIDFSLTALQIIEEAYALIRVGADGEALTSEMSDRALRHFQMMIKSWEADGLRLWCKTEGVLFLTESTAKYDLLTANSCLVDDYIETALSADAAETSTMITVENDDGIANGDRIGIELDDGTVQWTTVSGTPVANVVTLAAALTGDASGGGKVYSYTARAERPLKLLQARTRDSNGNELEMRILERPDYFKHPNKTATGRPLEIYHDPQLADGHFYIWPTPDDETMQIRYTFSRRINDVDSLVNTMDIPQEWYEAIVWNLAARLSYTTSFPMDERIGLIAVAKDMKDKLDGWDREYGSVFFSPGY